MSSLKRLSEQLIQRILTLISDCFVVLDSNKKVIHWSPQAEKVFQYTENEAIGQKLTELIGLPTIKLKATGELSSGVKSKAKDGTVLHIIPLSSNSYRDENGSCFTVWLFRDISKKKQIDRMMDTYTDNLYNEYSTMEAKKTQELLEINSELKKTLDEKRAEIKRRVKIESELMNLRNLLSNIIGSMPSALISLDCNKMVTLWNRETEKLTSTPAEERIGQPLPLEILDLIGSEKLIDEVQKSGISRKIEKVERHYNEEVRYYDITIFPIENSIIEGVVIRMDDITKRLQVQELMVQTEKMVSLGSIAAGIAHEVNNPLAGVSQNTQVIMQRLTKDIPANRRAAEEVGLDLKVLYNYLEKREIITMLDSVVVSTEKAAKIVKEMLDFSYRARSITRVCDVEELINKTVQLIKSDYSLKKNYNSAKVKILTKNSSHKNLIECDPVKLQQVFFNLLKNAIQALNGFEEPTIEIRLAESEGMLKIEFEDNGPGIAEPQKKKIFEPFYTTKDIGEGTGLGLSISYFIITDNHKGKMSLSSIAGRGSCFIVELPFELSARHDNTRNSHF